MILRTPFVMEGLEVLKLGLGTTLFLTVFIHINLVLAVFNFLPLHPLDGSHVLQNLLPLNQASRFEAFNRRVGSLLLIALVLCGYVTPISPLALLVQPPVDFLSSLLLGS